VKHYHHEVHVRDWHGIIATRVARQARRFRDYASGIRAKRLAMFWGVEMGAGCSFHGPVHFRRDIGSSIVIGEHCVFRSTPWSNPVGINRPCMLIALRGSRIALGNHSGFSGTVISATMGVTIGDRVLCGANVTITDNDWHQLDPEDRLGLGEAAPIVIEDNVWLGLGVVVLKGVTIGHDSVVAAGSIVSDSIPPLSLAAGCPARVIREIGRT